MLSDRFIRNAIINGNINIEPFDESKLGPVSYDLTVGQLYIPIVEISELEIKTKWVKQRMPYEAPYGRIVGFKTLEKITIKEGTCMAGIVSMRSGATRAGLFGTYSCLVDPGFSGRITVTMIPFLDPYTFTKESSVSQIMFYETTPIDKFWTGEEKQYGSSGKTS